MIQDTILTIIPNQNTNLQVFSVDWFEVESDITVDNIFEYSQPVIAFRIESKILKPSPHQGNIPKKRIEEVSFITVSGDVDPEQQNIVVLIDIKTEKWDVLSFENGKGFDKLLASLKNLYSHK